MVSVRCVNLAHDGAIGEILLHRGIGLICRFDEIHHFIREGKDALLGFAEAICLDVPRLKSGDLLSVTPTLCPTTAFWRQAKRQSDRFAT
jgi:hypothetical protein